MANDLAKNNTQQLSQSAKQLNSLIDEEITQPVKCLIENGHTTSAAKLLLSAIELLAYLNMPDNCIKPGSKGYKKWTKRFMELVSSGRVTQEEVYATRCDLLHTHGYRPPSNERQGIRFMVFSRTNEPSAYESSEIEITYININEFLDDFLAGVEQCVNNLFSNNHSARRTKQRLAHVNYLQGLVLTLNGHKLMLKGMTLRISRYPALIADDSGTKD